MAMKYIIGEIINSSFIGALVNPQKISIGCKKYKFKITKLLSFTSFLKIRLKVKPIRIKMYIVATETNASIVYPKLLFRILS